MAQLIVPSHFCKLSFLDMTTYSGH